jgi:hypothetical protein
MATPIKIYPWAANKIKLTRAQQLVSEQVAKGEKDEDGKPVVLNEESIKKMYQHINGQLTDVNAERRAPGAFRPSANRGLVSTKADKPRVSQSVNE